MKILKEIQNRIEKDTRPLGEVYAGLKQLGTYMMATNTMSKEQVITFCAGLIKLYEDLKPKKEQV